MRNLLFASILLVSSSIFGADKFFSQETGAIDLTLDGPTSAKIGELIELDAGDVPYLGTPSWVVITPPKLGGWKVFTSDREDGKIKKNDSFVFSTPYPGKYGIVFSFSILDTEGMKPEGVEPTKIKTQSIIHWITVTSLDEKPEPTPEPQPDPKPTPDLTDKYGLIKLTRDAVSTIQEPQKSQRTIFSDVFASVAAQIAAGTIKDIDEINTKTVSGIRSKIVSKADRDIWNKGFLEKLDKKIEDLEDSGQLNTLDNYRECYSDISKGLK